MALILVIDDNGDFLEVMREALKLQGFQVLTAENGTEGIAMALEYHPAVILCDLMMPDKTGWDVYEALQQHGDTTEIPFVYMTANSRFRGTAGELWLSKPFSIGDVTTMVKRMLDVEP